MTSTKKHFKSAEISTLSTDQTKMLMGKVGKERPHVVSAYKVRLCSPTDFLYLCNTARFRVALVALNTATEETKLFESDHITKKQRVATVSEIASIIGLDKKASRGLRVSHSFKAGDVVEALGIEQNIVKPKRLGYSTGGVTVENTIHWIDTRKAGEEGWVVFLVLLDTDGGTLTWLDPNAESAQAEDINYSLPSGDTAYALPAGSPFSKFGVKFLSENALSVLGRLIMDSGDSCDVKISKFVDSVETLEVSEVALGVAYVLSECDGDFNELETLYINSETIPEQHTLIEMVSSNLEEFSGRHQVVTTAESVEYGNIIFKLVNGELELLKDSNKKMYDVLGTDSLLATVNDFDESNMVANIAPVLTVLAENDSPIDYRGFMLAGCPIHIPCFSDIVDELCELGLKIDTKPTDQEICSGMFRFTANGFEFYFTTSGNVDELTIAKLSAEKVFESSDYSDLDLLDEGPERPWYKKLCNFLTGKGWN